MATLRAIGIVFVFLIVTLILMPWQWTAVRFKLKRRKTFPHRFHKFLCRLFGVRARVIGVPVQDRGVLMVANHTSYMDILVLSDVYDLPADIAPYATAFVRKGEPAELVTRIREIMKTMVDPGSVL